MLKLTNNKTLFRIFAIVCIMLCCLSCFSGCSKNDKKSMLAFAENKYAQAFEVVKFSKKTTNRFGSTTPTRIKLKDSNDVYFYVTKLGDSNYFDNYLDMLVSHQMQGYIAGQEHFKDLQGVYCINTILQDRNLDYNTVKSMTAEDILNEVSFSEIDFTYNVIGENGYIAQNIESLYALYLDLQGFVSVDAIDFEVVVTPVANDSLINLINQRIAPLYDDSEWYELYNLYYNKIDVRYESNPVIVETLLVDVIGIDDVSYFYSFRDDLSYDFEEYVKCLNNGTELPTQYFEPQISNADTSGS